MKSTIYTERLIIRPYIESDKQEVIELLTNEQIKMTFMIPNLESQAQREAMFKKLYDMSYSSERVERAICAGNRVIGFVNDVGITDGVIEMGYVIHPDFHNMGYATEMFSTIIDELFIEGFKQVKAGAFEENAASMRVMQKCGMKRSAFEDDIEYHGKIHHCIYYEINCAERNGCFILKKASIH